MNLSLTLPEPADLSDIEVSPFYSDSIATETPIARDFVYRKEPLTAHEVFSPFMLKGSDSPESTSHPFNGLCKMCAQKEPPVETKLDQLWRQIHPTLAPGWFPVNCCEPCYAAAQVDEARLAANRAFWDRVCPTEFQKPWDQQRGNNALLAKVQAFNLSLRRGLIIHGASDTGKTRAIWRLLKRLSEDGAQWLFLESIDLIDDIPASAYTVPLLVIDDLGNDQLSGPKEVRFLKLIRTRCNWHRPVIITTQFNSAAIASKFSQTATATAILRRLSGFCDQITAK